MRPIGALATMLTTCAAIGLTACESTRTTASKTRADTAALGEAAGDAEVVLVAMHADWCGVCKRLGPKMQEAMASYRDSPIVVIKADHTDRRDPAARATLERAGLADLYEQNGGTTGVLYLVDAQTGEVLDTIYGGRATVLSIRDDIDAALRTAG